MSKIEYIIEIPNWPKYLLSTNGDLYSEWNGKMIKRKQCKDKDGYIHITLHKNGKRHTKKIHRLMGELFLKRIEGKNEIDHINRIKTDNRLSNLRWVNSRENKINRGIDSRNKSGITGVRYRKDKKRWEARIHISSRKAKRRNFKTKEEAVSQRREWEDKYYKD
jgi:hypothetical protein